MTASEFIEVLNRPLGELPHELAMVPLPGPFNVEVRPPGSKSLTNRALLLAALAEGESVITGALIDADDARAMIEALRQLGAGIEFADEPGPQAKGALRITGTAGRLRGNCTLNLKNAGTATRFLTAAACLADGPVVIDGNERMRQRPIGELVAMLRQLGVTVDELGKPGCVPLRVHPIPASVEQKLLRIGHTASSQFVSAVLMIGQLLPRGLLVEFEGPMTSVSYIEMTLELMDDWPGGSGDYGLIQPGAFAHLHRGRYGGHRYEIEPDASGATYWWAAEAISRGSRVRVPGLAQRSLQGDARFADVLARMTSPGGSLRGIDADLSLMPDAAMTLAAVACFAEGTTTINGLRTLRVKETDRLAAMQTELSKLGAQVEIFSVRAASTGLGGLVPSVGDEGLRITPPPGGIDCSSSAPGVVFDTYDDHRMAMSLALIGLRRPNVVIRDPQCVAKTYPTYWRGLSLLYQSAAAGGALRSQ